MRSGIRWATNPYTEREGVAVKYRERAARIQNEKEALVWSGLVGGTRMAAAGAAEPEVGRIC